MIYHPAEIAQLIMEAAGQAIMYGVKMKTANVVIS